MTNLPLVIESKGKDTSLSIGGHTSLWLIDDVATLKNVLVVKLTIV